MSRRFRHLVLLAGCLAAAIISVGAGSTAADVAAGSTPATMPASTATKATAMCPVTPNEPVDVGVFSDYQGRRVYFCCSKCRAKFRRSPESYAANLPAVVEESRDSSMAATGDSNAGHNDQAADHQDHTDQPHEHGTGATQPVTTGQRHPTAPVETAHHDESRSHDHATGHGHSVELSDWDRLARFAGKFHPTTVHLPIALLLSALLAEALFVVTGAAWLSGAARFCVLLGALGAVVAATLGWLDAAFAGYEGEMLAVLNTHRWLGTSIAAWSIVLTVLSETSRRKPNRSLRWSYRMALLIGTVLVGVTGHFGATLIYGLDYLRW